MFETISDLQSSQTKKPDIARSSLFETISDLQSSQTIVIAVDTFFRLRLFLIYKALKRE